MITKKKQLEMALQAVPPHPHPKPDFEQYHTPAKIAADVLWNARTFGDLQDLKVVDLGCGTGILAMGAALMGASEVVGVDVDPDALQVAEGMAQKLHILDKCSFLEMDIRNFQEEADTVIQNPPFGAQKANYQDADRRFLEKALEISSVVYSFHLAKTMDFLKLMVKALDASISHVFHYNFPLPRIYHFHRDEMREVEVVVLRIEKLE